MKHSILFLLILFRILPVFADSCEKEEKQIEALYVPLSDVKERLDAILEHQNKNDSHIKEIQTIQSQLYEMGGAVADASVKGCEAIIAIRNSSSSEERSKLLKEAQELRQQVESQLRAAQEALNRASLASLDIQQTVEDLDLLKIKLIELQNQVDMLSNIPTDCQGRLSKSIQSVRWEIQDLKQKVPHSKSLNTDSLLIQIQGNFEELKKRVETVRVCEELARREIERPIGNHSLSRPVEQAFVTLAEAGLRTFPHQDSPKSVESQELFVVAKSYFPKMPESLPDGMKYKDYFQRLQVQDAHFQPSHQPVILHFTPKALSSFPEAMRAHGTPLSLPIHIAVHDRSQPETTTLTGSLLLEILQIYPSYESLILVYPPSRYSSAKSLEAMRKGNRPKLGMEPNSKWSSPFTFFEFDNPQGTFQIDLSNSEIEMKSEGGPLRMGWSEADQKDNIALASSTMNLLNCFVATAVYGSWNAPQLDTLRRYRDQVLQNTPEGRRLIECYYRYGPDLAVHVRDNPILGAVLRPLFDIAVWLLNKLDFSDANTRSHAEHFVQWLDSVTTEPTFPLIE